jgi:chitinase
MLRTNRWWILVSIFFRQDLSLRLRHFLSALLCFSVCAAAYGKVPKRPRYEVVAYVMAPQPGALLDATTIAAAKLTRINYAFFMLKDGVISERRDHDGDNLRALVSLKQQNPQLQVILSVGGGSGSAGFSEMASTAEGRKKFVDSAMAMIERFNLDGIDVDWEYPGYTHTAGMKVGPEDGHNYTLVLRDLRRRFDKEEKRLGRQLVTSSATGATQKWLDNTEMGKAAKWMTSVNMMCYDWYSAREKNTGHDSPLYTNPQDPKQISIDDAVKMNLKAGVPRRKLVIGVPFYGRRWTGVGPANHGLWQPVTGKGSDILFWQVAPLVNANGFVRYWDPVAEAPYLYNAQSGTFITYNDAEAEKARTAYVKRHHLGGIMFWQYSGDPNNILLDAINSGFAQH